MLLPVQNFERICVAVYVIATNSENASPKISSCISCNPHSPRIIKKPVLRLVVVSNCLVYVRLVCSPPILSSIFRLLLNNVSNTHSVD